MSAILALRHPRYCTDGYLLNLADIANHLLDRFRPFHYPSLLSSLALDRSISIYQLIGCSLRSIAQFPFLLIEIVILLLWAAGNRYEVVVKLLLAMGKAIVDSKESWNSWTLLLAVRIFEVGARSFCSSALSDLANDGNVTVVDRTRDVASFFAHSVPIANDRSCFSSWNSSAPLAPC
jgi:hypothetical protein